MEEQHPAPASAWPSAGNLFKQAMEIYKARTKTLLLISLIGLGVIFIASLFLGIKTTAIGSSVQPANPLFFLIYFIIACVVGVLMQGALLSAVSASSDEGVSVAFKHASSRFWALLLTGILSGIAIAVGFILLIIPGIIVIVWLAVSSYVVILEGKSGFAALKASKAYVSGRWSKVAWYLLIIILAAFGLGIILGIVGGALSFVSVYVTLLISLAAQIVLVPLVSAYMYMVYDTLRNRPQA